MKILMSKSALIFFLSLSASFYTFNTAAQQKVAPEIKFSKNSFKEALAAAKASHKKLFVDAFATWCGPCKELRKHTFNDPEAAAYFNKHFVNLSVDVEKGEGVELARTWRIEGLPTLLIVDDNGKILASHTGFVDGTGLIEFAREATETGQPKQIGAVVNP